MTNTNDKLQLPVKDLNDKEIRLFILGIAHNVTRKEQTVELAQEWYAWVIGKN